MIAYSLAARLNKTVCEILDLSVEEFVGWQAFFELSKEQER